MTLFNADLTNFDIVSYPEANDYDVTLNTSGTANTFLGVGNYAEIVPADTITTDSYIIGFFLTVSDAGRKYRIRFATGDSGSEVDIIDISTPVMTNITGVYIPIPRKELTSNTRLSFDATDNEAAANAVYISVQLEVPR